MFLWLCVSVVIEQPVKIKLTDVNDELPRFVNVPRPFLATVNQNAPPGSSVYQLMARDDDRDSVVQYALESGRCRHCTCTMVHPVDGNTVVFEI